jgi:hypothetical protein
VKVVCEHAGCNTWATAYISKYEGPYPVPRHDPDAPYDQPGPAPMSLEEALGIEPRRKPLWYACTAHQKAFHKSLEGLTHPPVCEVCGDDEGVAWESSRTAYHEPRNVWTELLENIDDAPPSPNRDVALCRYCAEEHHRNWDEQWASYYGSLLG